MKKEHFDELLQSVKEAAAIERGQAKPSRTFEVKTANDVVRVRSKLGLSQPKFARLLGISENTLQNWEQGPSQTRRSGEGIAESGRPPSAGGSGSGIKARRHRQARRTAQDRERGEQRGTGERWGLKIK